MDPRRRHQSGETVDQLQRGQELRAVAAAGFDPIYGARPLKRAIQQQIENPLAKELLAGKFAAGDAVKVGAAAGEITFAKG